MMVKQHWIRRPWRAWLVLVRGILLVLSLGQDLGYIAGYGFTSFTLSALWILAVEVARTRGRPNEMLSSLGARARLTWADARSRPRASIALAINGPPACRRGFRGASRESYGPLGQCRAALTIRRYPIEFVEAIQLAMGER